jgi:hypothetical protein
MVPASYTLVFVPALSGTALGAIAYLGPFGTTGVEGTPGALLALVGAGAVALDAVVAIATGVRGWMGGLLDLLLGSGSALTALAAWFLMQQGFAMAMGLAFLGLLVAILVPGRRRMT